MLGAAAEYATDAAQRCVLFLDVMRQRGNAYREHVAQTAPHVLDYQVRTRRSTAASSSGRSTTRLVRIVPPEGVEIDPAPPAVRGRRSARRATAPASAASRPTARSAWRSSAGHPCYFIGFLPEPMPGQTIEDIARAEAIFLEKVIALHPEADGKPCVIGNCQAGWAVMMPAALRPELFGPIIVAGSPLSYWAGVRGQYPMRYQGGLAGRQLADGARRRSWLRQVRRRLAGAELREPEPGQHALDQAVQSLFQDRHRGRALSRTSNAGGAATSI